ncbi:MAG: diaminopropionate ammonia-lyase [Pseudoramibacter sp.]
MTERKSIERAGIHCVVREPKGRGAWDRLFAQKAAELTAAYHQTIPGYVPTPLVDLKHLADHYGVAKLCVKDESKRFGLNAFKSLGGSYCIANVIAEKAGRELADLTFAEVKKLAEDLKDLTFVTATDGNHGRGIAWTAKTLGVKAKVFMPKGSAAERLNNIKALGADAEITPWNYDDTVRHAAKTAEENHWPLVQDTAWPGYEKIPGWIMQGYLTMAKEAFDAFDGTPTHLFLQAGVGSMAGAVAAFASDYYGEKKPVIIVVEPDQADCIYRTAAADDGKRHAVTGDMHSIMAGLCCGEPCTLGWEELDAHAEGYVSMPDAVAAKGMRTLGAPLPGDPRIISGESGASTTGFVCELLENPELSPMREALHIDSNARILCISTEGDTDRENYRNITWNGAYCSAQLDS